MTQLGRTVLIVENDPTLRELIRLTLLPLELEILEAADLHEARAHLKRRVDLLILDFYLEPESGTDLLDDLPPDVPVLLLTASFEVSGLQQKFPRLNAVMRKPFDSRELRAVAKALMDVAHG